MGRIGTRTVRASLLAAGITALAAGTGTAGGAAGSDPPTLSANKLAVGLPAVTYGQSVRLSGRERHAGPRTAVLQANPFPFTAGFKPIARERTHGAYAFTVRLSRATQYRVVVNGATGATSRALTVYVIPQGVTTYCNLCSLNNSSGAHMLMIKGLLRPDAGIGPVYFYYGQVNGPSAPKSVALVKTVSPQITSGGDSFTVSYEVHFPSGPSRFRYTYCRQDNEALDGYGLPGHHHCGDARVNTSEYLG